MKWYPFFSQTGFELAEIIDAGFTPSIIFTNRKDLSKIDERLKKFKIVQFKEFDELNVFRSDLETGLVTLHGFLRIFPKEFIFNNMFNGHPGLITKYPVLKGKDPQIKAFDLKLETSGCVIHKVVEEVDSGEILLSKEVEIKHLNLDQIYDIIKINSIALWKQFLKETL